MPYFEHPVDYDVDNLLSYMDKLFECVDRVQIFRILGGEPFLFSDLDKVIDKALSCSKLKTVEIVTNGTIVPKQELFEHMKDPRLLVQISDYGDYSRKKTELKQACDSYGVCCVLRDENEKTWFDAGGLYCRHRTTKELKRQMKHCGNISKLFRWPALFLPKSFFWYSAWHSRPSEQ